jgi:hypothetical protein
MAFDANRSRITRRRAVAAAQINNSVTSKAWHAHAEGIMRHKLNDRRSLWLAAAVALIGLSGLGLPAAHAQPVAPTQNGPKPVVRYAQAALYTSGSGPYYIEFRSRYAWDYGHTYLVHGKVGQAPTHDSVAGLSPVGDDATAWVIGHYVPVPAETGWTDGDLEDKYVTARYRVLMSKEQYDRTLAYIQKLQASSHMWSAELYNCNAFVGDVAKYMGLQVPASSLIYPRIFVTHLRLINTGHPEAAQTLVSDNVKEMSNPLRDGRAMINSGIHTIHPDGTPATVAEKPSSTPKVTIGTVQVSTRTPSSPAPNHSQ